MNPFLTACLPRRTPQGIRALVRCYCTLLLPVFFGPHYASLRSSIHIVYALFLAVVVRAKPHIWPCKAVRALRIFFDTHMQSLDRSALSKINAGFLP